MKTFPDIRKAILWKPRHCWLRLRRHKWVSYTVEYVDPSGQFTIPEEAHRVCVWCRLTQVQVGSIWMKCVFCRAT